MGELLTSRDRCTTPLCNLSKGRVAKAVAENEKSKGTSGDARNRGNVLITVLDTMAAAALTRHKLADTSTAVRARGYLAHNLSSGSNIKPICFPSSDSGSTS
jgi:formylmethanofuran dehydrogenase subunit B